MEPVDVRASRPGRDRFGLVVRRQLTDVGIDVRTVRRRLSRGDWTEPLPGVINLGTHPGSWEQDLMAVVLAAGDGAVVSYRSAAFLHGYLDVPRPVSLDVTVPRRRHAAVGGVRLHTTTTLDPRDVCGLGPFPCTSMERTHLDLAAVLRPPELEPLLWDTARRVVDMPQRLVAAILRHPAAPGRRSLESLLAGLHPELGSAESPLEIYGLLALRDAGAPPPELQHVVRDAAGRFVGRVDAAWPDVRVVVEFDGAPYHRGPARSGRDARRRERLRELGWHVIVLEARDLRSSRCRAVAIEIRTRRGM